MIAVCSRSWRRPWAKSYSILLTKFGTTRFTHSGNSGANTLKANSNVSMNIVIVIEVEGDYVVWIKVILYKYLLFAFYIKSLKTFDTDQISYFSVYNTPPLGCTRKGRFSKSFWNLFGEPRLLLDLIPIMSVPNIIPIHRCLGGQQRGQRFPIGVMLKLTLRK